MPVTGDIDSLIQNLNDALGDASKHDRGIDAAGRRLRKKLSEIAKTCKEIRAKIQENAVSKIVDREKDQTPYFVHVWGPSPNLLTAQWPLRELRRRGCNEFRASGSG